MPERPLRVLLEGRPAVGKTTVIRRLSELLRDAGVPVGGFITEERREHGRRVGFMVESLEDDGRAVLAHVGLPGPPRVGRYGVDLAAFEQVALPALAAKRGRRVLIDELGKMELASEAFRDAVWRLLEQPVAVVATVHVARYAFTDDLKRRPGVEIVRVTRGNRDELPAQLALRLAER